MTKTAILDEVSRASSTLTNLMYLAQAVSEDYFDKYTNAFGHDKDFILYEFDRFRALYGILYVNLTELQIKLNKFNDNITAAASS